VAPLETTVTPNSKDVREGGQEASPKRESGHRAVGGAGVYSSFNSQRIALRSSLGALAPRGPHKPQIGETYVHPPPLPPGCDMRHGVSDMRHATRQRPWPLVAGPWLEMGGPGPRPAGTTTRPSPRCHPRVACLARSGGLAAAP
jgi:hypothetical protein